MQWWGWAIVFVGLVAFFIWGVRRMNVRRGPVTLGGIRVEVTAPHIVEDRVMEAMWAVPVIYTNTSRRPARVPVLAARATVQAGRRRYAGELKLDRRVIFDDGSLELNPQDTLTGSVLVRLPRDEEPRMVELAQYPAQRKLRYRVRVVPADQLAAATSRKKSPRNG